MSFKESGLYSVLSLSCPRCRKGKLFKTKSAYRKKMTEMYENCPHCNEDFVREPGYYFGAAYTSYALTVALWVTIFAALTLLDAIGLITFSFFHDAILFLTVGSLSLLLLFPLIFRLSRSMWIHTFVKYRKDAREFNLEKERERHSRISNQASV